MINYKSALRFISSRWSEELINIQYSLLNSEVYFALRVGGEVIIMIIYKLKHEDYEKIKCILDGHFRPGNDGIMQQ